MGLQVWLAVLVIAAHAYTVVFNQSMPVDAATAYNGTVLFAQGSDVYWIHGDAIDGGETLNVTVTDISLFDDIYGARSNDGMVTIRKAGTTTGTFNGSYSLVAFGANPYGVACVYTAGNGTLIEYRNVHAEVYSRVVIHGFPWATAFYAGFVGVYDITGKITIVDSTGIQYRVGVPAGDTGGFAFDDRVLVLTQIDAMRVYSVTTWREVAAHYGQYSFPTIHGNLVGVFSGNYTVLDMYTGEKKAVFETSGISRYTGIIEYGDIVSATSTGICIWRV